MIRLPACAALLVLLVLTACAQPSAGGGGARPNQPSDATAPARTLVVATRAEPPSLSGKAFRSLGLTADLSRRMFNAGLTIRGDDGQPVPYLAEAVPQLRTETAVDARL